MSKWSEESIAQEALKYSSKAAFRKNAHAAYLAAFKRGLLDKVCSHMAPLITSWNPDNIRDEALKYKSHNEFAKSNRSAYEAAKRLGILEDVSRHMTSNKKWDYEKLHNEALKHVTRSQFKEAQPSAYKTALDHGVIDRICSHMSPSQQPGAIKEFKPFKPPQIAKPLRVKKIFQPPIKKVKGPVIWHSDKIAQEALKYSSKTEFANQSGSAYNAARKLNILDKVCSHMEEIHVPFSIDLLRVEVLKYNKRSDFKNSNPYYYRMAIQHNILDEVCSHMTWVPEKKWNKESISCEAIRYKKRMEFKINSRGAYYAACDMGILEEVCSHMKNPGGNSTSETNLFSMIKEKFPKAQKLRDRNIDIKDKPHVKGFDIDIYIPELRKGIEFDGTYWHSVAGLKRSRDNWPENDLINYHHLKDEHFKSKGIELFHITENDWMNDREECIRKCMEFLQGDSNE